MFQSGTTTASISQETDAISPSMYNQSHDNSGRSDRSRSITAQSNVTVTVTKYSKLTYQYERRMFIRDNVTREFRFLEQWKSVSSYLVLKASSVDIENRRMRMYVFFSEKSLEGVEGEPFYPYSYDGTTTYEFPSEEGSYTHVVHGIEPWSKKPKNKYINVVVERVECSTCAHTIMLTMEVHKGVAIATSAVLGAILLAVFAGTVLGVVFCGR